MKRRHLGNIVKAKGIYCNGNIVHYTYIRISMHYIYTLYSPATNHNRSRSKNITTIYGYAPHRTGENTLRLRECTRKNITTTTDFLHHLHRTSWTLDKYSTIVVHQYDVNILLTSYKICTSLVLLCPPSNRYIRLL